MTTLYFSLVGKGRMSRGGGKSRKSRHARCLYTACTVTNPGPRTPGIDCREMHAKPEPNWELGLTYKR